MKLNFPRREAAKLIAVALALASVGMHATAHNHDDDDDGKSLRQGKLFMSTNAVGGNVLQVYARSANGPATLLNSIATNGSGTGAGLGSQGAVTLSTNGRYLFVVNAGSNTVSTFKLGGKSLVLVSTVSSGGSRPISVAESDGVVYVLNSPATDVGNTVVGFHNEGGVLVPLSDGKRALPDASGPGQVGFDTEGEVLVVSEKNVTQLASYRVRGNGTLSSTAQVTPSPGAVPFGFGFTKRNVLVVSEAGTSSASSYRLGEKRDASLQLVTAALANGQGAACWIAVTPDGRYAYSANAAASNVSAYGIDRAGKLTLLQAQAGFTSGNGALDMAITPDGRQLHVFASRSPQQIVSFTIGSDGTLGKIGSLNVTAGAGLAVN
ncbi:MAG: 6-phosphogluconolactonase [Bradyrhizobium sp.]|jgi:6-phosphogluconolactonase